MKRRPSGREGRNVIVHGGNSLCKKAHVKKQEFSMGMGRGMHGDKGMETRGREAARGKASRGAGRWTGTGAEGRKNRPQGHLMGDEQDSAAGWGQWGCEQPKCPVFKGWTPGGRWLWTSHQCRCRDTFTRPLRKCLCGSTPLRRLERRSGKT